MSDVAEILRDAVKQIPKKEIADISDLFQSVVTEEAMRRCNGNQVKTADLLGICRQTLQKRLVKFDLYEDAINLRDMDRMTTPTIMKWVKEGKTIFEISYHTGKPVDYVKKILSVKLSEKAYEKLLKKSKLDR